VCSEVLPQLLTAERRWRSLAEKREGVFKPGAVWMVVCGEEFIGRSGGEVVKSLLVGSGGSGVMPKTPCGIDFLFQQVQKG
jgi:hypothetical protein